MPSIQVIYGSISGHTEYVVDELVSFLKDKAPDLEVSVQKAEETEPEDLLKGDILILGSGTWNMDGIEGQLGIHMYELLKKRAKDIDLKEKPCAVITLGDYRYYYTARANEHMQQFLMSSNGKQCCPPLTIINEPYGQEEKIEKWGEKLIESIK